MRLRLVYLYRDHNIKPFPRYFTSTAWFEQENNNLQIKKPEKWNIFGDFLLQRGWLSGKIKKKKKKSGRHGLLIYIS